MTTTTRPRRHRWAHPREHLYLCRRCGTAKVNALERGEWIATWHQPDGSTQRGGTTPPCEPGAKTDAYLAKYGVQREFVT